MGQQGHPPTANTGRKPGRLTVQPAFVSLPWHARDLQLCLREEVPRSVCRVALQTRYHKQRLQEARGKKSTADLIYIYRCSRIRLLFQNLKAETKWVTCETIHLEQTEASVSVGTAE